MKKLCILIMVTMILSGCTTGKRNEIENFENSPKIIKAEEDLGKYDFLTRYAGCEYDITDDGVEEEFLLLTSAKKDDSGEYMWDDSQEWALIVKSDMGTYTLFNEYMRGKIDFYLSERYESDGSISPVIRLEVSSGSEFFIKEYTYNNDAFEEKMVYNSGAINEISIEKY